MNEFVDQFLLECRELIEQATRDLLALEENPADIEALDSAFRAFHTLKGSAGIVDFDAMTKATHIAEDVLASVRTGKARVSRDLISNCLGCLDVIVQWLDAMQLDGEIPAGADADAAAIIRRFENTRGEDTNRSKEGPSSSIEKQTPTVTDGLSNAALSLLEAQVELLSEQNPEGFIGRLLSAGQVGVNVLRSSGLNARIAELEKAAAEAAAAEDRQPLLTAIEELLAEYRLENTKVEINFGADAAARVLRVDVERIDSLVKLTGELTVAANAIGHAAQTARSSTDPNALAELLTGHHAQISRLIGELQRSVLSIRVLPLRHIFNRFPRLVRELAETLEKPVKLATQGDETEADKVVVENLFEPLLHIIRNALDHGVEDKVERAALGKPPIANIQLRASRIGDVILIEVEDDGRGIDVEKIRRLAVERGLADADAAAGMTEDEVADFVFAAGFSTANKVTDLSGRGVGMDVVRRNVERLGGTARISSRKSQGTIVTLKLPFSVMMTRVMTVDIGGQTFGIGFDNVVETTRLARDQISPVGQGWAFVLRNRTIPLIDLSEMLNITKPEKTASEAKIVIVSLGGYLAGFEVDAFGDRLDVMLKPMDGLLQGMPGVAGTSLMGDGRVLIILDLVDLLRAGI